MKVHYVNRKDREDRHYLFRGAMGTRGWAPGELIRVIAKRREDYPTRAQLCDAASEDGFAGFFQRVRDRDYPGYGHLCGGWSQMRSWRMIAEGEETVLHMVDDYCIKQDKRFFDMLLEPLDDLNIAQLAWHTRDDVFFLDHYNLGIPYQHFAEEVSEKSPYFIKGTWHGCSDWALVLSPQGAAWILDYMETESPINAECVTTALHHARPRLTGIYSLRDQPRHVNGNEVLRDNPWVGHLVEYSDLPVSNLMGTHEIPDMDYEKDWSDKRLENKI